MASWTETNDTHTATINNYRVKISYSEQFGTWHYLITRNGRAVHAGAVRELEAAREQAEQEALDRDKA